MKQKFRILLREYRHPDSFRYDWYAWQTNQLSHAFIGLVAFIVLLPLIGTLATLLTVTILYALKELRDFRLVQDFWDSLVDWLFVTGGMLVGQQLVARDWGDLGITLLIMVLLMIQGTLARLP